MLVQTTRWLCIVTLCLITILVVEAPALAQGGPERGGFTIMGSLGLGVQHDAALEETAVGLAGLNFGVGGFLTEDLALMFRLSGTNVSYDVGAFEYDQVSGVGGVTLQYWVSDRFNVEAGGGLGFWSSEIGDEPAFGLILAAGVTIFNRGKHNLQVGLEYAPAFTDPGAVHNLGLTLGYQFF